MCPCRGANTHRVAAAPRPRRKTLHSRGGRGCGVGYRCRSRIGSALGWSASCREKGAVSAWRHLVPAHSPLSMAALLAGARAAAARNGGSARAEEHVVELLKERYSAMAVLLTESGTAALTAALRGALRDRPGAAVALPAYACYDLATAADGAGVSVFLYDVDPHTLAPDLAQLRAALNQGAAAVVVVHLYGYPVDLAQVSAVAAETGAVVIEDAAQAAGAVVKDRPAGTQGSLTVLSFGRGKGLTGGSGGALLAND